MGVLLTRQARARCGEALEAYTVGIKPVLLRRMCFNETSFYRGGGS